MGLDDLSIDPAIQSGTSNHSDTSNHKEGIASASNESLPNFRVRLFPTWLLWSICVPMLLYNFSMLGYWAYSHIRYGWIEPDLARIQYIDNQLVSPPIIAGAVPGIPAGFFGIMAARAWMRGNWSRAVKLTLSFTVLALAAAYLGGGR